ncbi:MAG: type II toxin-antitoxin system Phd/YefM family antitoxin [bacterium]|nr:type II toxin-antitoxin system Phd/YefM family antitoxin [bacterium]
MKLSEDIRPISYVKAHAAELLKDLIEHPRTLVITQKGEAKAVLQDVASYERTQASLALLRRLAEGQKELEAGNHRPADEVFSDLRRDLGL